MNASRQHVSRISLRASSVAASLLWSTNLAAQCAMCRTALTNSAEGQRWARGINGGIMLLLLAPFLIVGLIALQIYAHHVNAGLRQMYRRCKKRISRLRRRPQRAVASIAAQQSDHGGA